MKIEVKDLGAKVLLSNDQIAYVCAVRLYDGFKVFWITSSPTGYCTEDDHAVYDNGYSTMAWSKLDNKPFSGCSNIPHIVRFL